jgi:predicted Na+-dependent transporter
MKRLRKQHVLEQSIYGAIWIVIFLLPLIGGYFAMSGGLEREETRMVIRESWLSILPFFVLFLLNNYGLVPYFLFKKRYWQYTVSLIFVIGMMLAFSVSFCQSFPQRFQARRVASSYEGEPEGPDY